MVFKVESGQWICITNLEESSKKIAGIYCVGNINNTLLREFNLFNKDGAVANYSVNKGSIDGYFLHPWNARIKLLTHSEAEQLIGREGVQAIKENLLKWLDLPKHQYILERLFN